MDRDRPSERKLVLLKTT